MKIEYNQKTSEELISEIEELNKELIKRDYLISESEYQQGLVNSLFENNPHSIIMSSYSDKIVLYVNVSFVRNFGYSFKEIVGKNYLDTNLFDNPETNQNMLNILEKKVQYTENETEFVNKDGNRIACLVTVIQHEHNNKNDVIAFIRNITNRKIFEKTLEANEAEIRAIFNSVNIGIIVTDLKNNILEANKNIIALLGYSEDEFYKKSPYDFIYQEDVGNSIQIFDKIVKGELEIERIEKRYIRKDGTFLWADVSIIPIKNSRNETTSVIRIISDISIRKVYEKELIKLAKAVEISPVSIFIADKEGLIEYVNEQFCENTGYSKIDIIGKHFCTLYCECDSKEKIERFMESVLSNNDYRREIQVQKKNGEIYDEYIVSTQILDSKGAITNLLALNEDLSERKKAEKELLKLNQELTDTVRTKDKFFEILAHDLRGPFSGFLGLSDLMANNINEFTKEDIAQIAKSINISANSLFKLIENLFEWSRVQNKSMPFNEEKIDLTQIFFEVKSTLNQLAKFKNIDIAIENVSEESQIMGDKHMISAIFRNLINNSIKFTNEYGKIKVGIESDVAYPNNHIIYIKDNGIGLDNENKSNLFNIGKKVETKGTKGEKGTGLGLIICKEFVDKHKGKIWVESVKGEGSTFFVALPKI